MESLGKLLLQVQDASVYTDSYMDLQEGRSKVLGKRYNDLFTSMLSHVRRIHVCEECGSIVGGVCMMYVCMCVCMCMYVHPRGALMGGLLELSFPPASMVTAGHQNEPIPTILLRLKPGEG